MTSRNSIDQGSYGIIIHVHGWRQKYHKVRNNITLQLF